MPELLKQTTADCDLVYLGFRAAFVTLIDDLMGETLQLRPDTQPRRGFLERFALLESTAPQVQLECLLTTWDRLVGRRDLRLLDECVCQAALELLAELAASDSQSLLRMAWAGPRATTVPLDHWVGSWVRAVQITGLPVRSTWQLDMLHHVSADSRGALFQLDERQREERNALLELVGRWRVSARLTEAGQGLLADTERDLMRSFFEEHPGLSGEAVG